MPKPLSRSYFHEKYMLRIAAGELFIPEPESPAVDMFIAELNKSPKGDADFSVYKFDDVDWCDFLGDIFSSEEYRERTETGYEYRAIYDTACAEYLRTFIGKIKKTETKLTLLKFFMSDGFCQNVLDSGYCAYRSSADMIRMKCAELMGEINRSIYGELAPDSREDDKSTPAKRLIASVNRGEVQARRADWSVLVQEGYDTEQKFPPVSFLHVLLQNLTDLTIFNHRIDALHTIEENLSSYLQKFEVSEEVLRRYLRDCKCLLHYFRHLMSYIPNSNEAGLYYNAHRKDDQMDVEAYLYLKSLDNEAYLTEYLALTQSYYVAFKSRFRGTCPSLIAAQSYLYLDKLAAEDITSFCMSLYIAEGWRKHQLTGDPNDRTMVDIHTFDVKLRNACFDEYIRLRRKDIEEELSADNDRLFEVTEKECLDELYKTENYVYNRIVGMEQFRGSEAYEREWYPAKPHVIKMSGYFIQYLEIRLRQNENPPSPSKETTTTKVTEDWSLIDNIWYCVSDSNMQDIQDFRSALTTYIKNKKSLDTIKQFLINKDKDGTITLPRKYINGGSNRQCVYDRAKIFRALKSIGLKEGKSRFYLVFPEK